MITALDSSIILDVISGGGNFLEASLQLLRKTRIEGKLILCECVVAEVYPALNDEQLFQQFMKDWQLQFIPSSEESAIAAGRYFAEYLARGDLQKRVLPDFLIGAHAQYHADRLAARDRGFLRDYFDGLTILDPSRNAASR
jgi:predicted nucleic acid-binding protein